MEKNKNKGGFTVDNAKYAGKKGGINSGITRRKRKLMREIIEEKIETEPEMLYDILNALIKEAKKGNIKAIELFRDIRGEKITEINASTVKTVFVTKDEMIEAQNHIKQVIEN